jgi:hypothetical protein
MITPTTIPILRTVISGSPNIQFNNFSQGTKKFRFLIGGNFPGTTDMKSGP